MPATQVSDVFQLEGTTLEGRFVIDRVVAEGGFGVVYHGQQVALERPIALKVLKTPHRFNEEARQEFLAHFASEAKTVARIAHPNIVMVHDFGVSEMPAGGRAAWMALEWLTGITLEAELLRRRGCGGRSPAKTLALLKPILSALAVVHGEGVAHRDVKPANIMLVPTAAGAVLKLLDFGLAKLMEADEMPGAGNTRSRADQIAFSPGYAAPEQISHGRSGPWTDVHALGLVLSETLTDRAPLDGDDLPLLFQQIVHPMRPTPAKRGVNVGPWELVLQRALAVSPAARYRDAGELLRALEATVTAASEVHVNIPNDVRAAAGLPPAEGSGDTLAAMSTQMDPSWDARAAPPMRSPFAMSEPTPSAGRVARKVRSRALPLYAALTIGLVGWLGWRVFAPTTARPSATSVGIVQPMDAEPAPPFVPPVAASVPPASPSAAASREPTPSAPPSSSASPPAASARARAPARSPAPRAASTSAPAPPPTPPTPAPSGDIVIE